jgi:hypothetical protein
VITSLDELLEQLAIGWRLGVGREIALGILPFEELHQSLSASSRGQSNEAISEEISGANSLTALRSLPGSRRPVTRFSENAVL